MVSGKLVSLSIELKSLLKLVTDCLHLVLLPDKTEREAELTHHINETASTHLCSAAILSST